MTHSQVCHPQCSLFALTLQLKRQIPLIPLEPPLQLGRHLLSGTPNRQILLSQQSLSLNHTLSILSGGGVSRAFLGGCSVDCGGVSFDFALLAFLIGSRSSSGGGVSGPRFSDESCHTKGDQ